MRPAPLMRRFTIRFRMWSAIGIITALVVFLGGAGLYGMARIYGMSEEFAGRSNALVAQMNDLRSSMGAARRHERDMIIQYESPEGVKASFAQWQSSLRHGEEVLARLRDGVQQGNQANTQKVAGLIADYRALFLPIVQQLSAQGYDSATIANRLAGPASARFEEAEAALAVVDAALRQDVETALREQAAVVRGVKLFFVVAVALGLLLVVPATLANMRSICGPLDRALRFAQAIARGDLTDHGVDARGRDETARLLQSLEDMRQSLGGLVGQVRSSADSLALASAEIATGNQDLSLRTEQTSIHLQRTASSMDQLTSAVQQSAQASQQANELSASAAAVAARGGEMVAQVVSTMQEINTSSRRIGDIIGVIDSIAFQTNILALNAAVEAARAGEQGRGFAVVAAEVRSLAGRSAHAAKEIKGLIGASEAHVQAGARMVNGAGQTMAEIVESVQHVSNVIGGITTAVAEQSRGIEEINSSVAQLDQMTQQNAALVEQSAAAAASMREQTERMAQVVGTFKLAYAALPAAIIQA